LEEKYVSQWPVISEEPLTDLCYPVTALKFSYASHHFSAQRRKPAMNPHYIIEKNFAAGYQELSSLCLPGNPKKHRKTLSHGVGSSGVDSHHSSPGQSTELKLQ
jgi:hypothetical protein